MTSYEPTIEALKESIDRANEEAREAFDAYIPEIEAALKSRKFASDQVATKHTATLHALQLANRRRRYAERRLEGWLANTPRARQLRRKDLDRLKQIEREIAQMRASIAKTRKVYIARQRLIKVLSAPYEAAERKHSALKRELETLIA